MLSEKYLIRFLFTGCVMIGNTSCKKLIAVDPPSDQIVSSEIFKSDATARAAATGIYSEMMNNANQFTTHAVSLYAGMSADELYYFSPGTRDEFVSNNLTGSNHATLETLFWTPAYRYIYWANSSIEQLERSTTLTPSVQKSLLGETKFVRAFCYFHLVNLFGDVPLALSSDYTVNQGLARAPKQVVYDQIVADLSAAYDLLGFDASNKGVRPSKWAAAALLSRVYLYQGAWVSAEDWATRVIGSGAFTLNTSLQNVFLKDSKETIWQLQPVNLTRNTWEGNMVLPASASSIPTFLIRPSLINAFEPGDGRFLSWIKSRVYTGQTLYYPYKYKVQASSTLTEYYVVLRLAEQYLIRAEARLRQNNTTGALQDVNTIRNRASLPSIAYTGLPALTTAVEHERQIELFVEWGHRWFDLKRTGRASAVLGSLKGPDWQETDQLYPIPVGQINANNALIQNPGY